MDKLTERELQGLVFKEGRGNFEKEKKHSERRAREREF